MLSDGRGGLIYGKRRRYHRGPLPHAASGHRFGRDGVHRRPRAPDDSTVRTMMQSTHTSCTGASPSCCWPCSRPAAAASRAFGRARARRAPATGTPPSSTTARPSRRTRTAPTTSIALERAMISASQRAPRSGARLRGARPARRGAARVPPRQRIRSAEPPGRRQGHRDRAPHPRPGRGGAAASRTIAAAARERAPDRAAAAVQPDARVLPGIRFNNASLRDILDSIGMAAGINVTYATRFQDRQLHGADGRRRRSRRR